MQHRHNCSEQRVPQLPHCPILLMCSMGIRYLKTHSNISTALCTRTYILTVLTQYNFGPRVRSCIYKWS